MSRAPGFHHAPETRARIAIARTHARHSPETRAKMSATHLARHAASPQIRFPLTPEIAAKLAQLTSAGRSPEKCGVVFNVSATVGLRETQASK